MKPSSVATSHPTHSLHRFLSRILWLEPIYLALLALPLLLPDTIIPLSRHPYLLLLLFFFWPLRLLSFYIATDISTNISLLRDALPLSVRYSLLLLLFLLPLSLWVSIDHTGSYIAMGYLLLGFTLYVALINWQPVQRQPRLLVQILAFIGIALALVAPLFTAWKVEFRLFRFPIYDLLRSVSLETLFGMTETIHANVLAGTLVLILPFLPIMAIDKAGNYAKINASTKLQWPWGWSLAILILISTIVLSQSRGAYLAVLLSIGLMCTVRWRKVLFVLIPMGMAMAALLFYVGDPFAALDVVATDSALGGAEFRIDVWSNSLYALSDFIFTGIGIGMFNQIVPEFYPFAYVNGAYAHHAHNLYLQIALDLGLLGLMAYLLLICGLFWMLVTTLRSELDVTSRLLAIGAVGSLVALLAHGLLDAVTWGTKLAFIPWIIFALITILYRQSQRIESKSVT